MEPTEIREFAEQMKEGGEAALTHVSLIISVLAVLVAMVTVVGHRTHTQAILLQTRSADQWNQYQAKKIRQEQVTVAADLLSLQPSSDDAAVQKKLGEYRAHLSKWNDELAEEQHKAQELEEDVDKAEGRADRYDMGEALLQIAVVLASITLLTRTKSYYFFGLVLGIAGLLWSASALLIR
jgi:Domain of unknown function (DUF4337)